MTALTKLATIAFAIALLHLGRALLQPLALATLLAFLLAPFTSRVERLGTRRSVAVGVVVVASFLLLGFIGWLVAAQVVDLANGVTTYRANLVAKVRALPSAPGAIERVGAVLGELGQELGRDAPAPGGDAVGGQRPLPVEVTRPSPPFSRLRSLVDPLLAPLGTAAVVVVFVIFFLLEREDLRDRLLRLAGEEQLLLATRAMDDAGRRVSRYLLAQLLVNAAYGVPVGVGLWFIGVPNAPLWGLLAVILRYLPYVGPWIAAAAPVALAAAVFPGWGRALVVVALFVVLELIVNNLVEPYVYGAHVGLSPVALLLAALFWAWLWGPLGLVLAAPLTVCLVVIGRHVHQLDFLAVLFADEPALPPAARLYQRLLARDTIEAAALVDERLTATGRDELFEEVLLPALALAERDRHRGALDEDQQRFVLASMSELLAETAAAGDDEDGTAEAVPTAPRRVLCIAARDEADALCASMLLRLLSARGVAAGRVLPLVLAGEVIAAVAAEPPDVVCLSALPPSATLRSLYLCKRLANRFPELPIVVGLWQASHRTAEARRQLIGAGAEDVVTSLSDAVTAVARVPPPLQPGAAR